MDDWIRAPLGNWPTYQLNLEFPWPYLQRQLHLEIQRARRIQELEHYFPMMRKPDWTVFHLMMKQLKGAARSELRPGPRIPESARRWRESHLSFVWGTCHHKAPHLGVFLP